MEKIRNKKPKKKALKIFLGITILIGIGAGSSIYYTMFKNYSPNTDVVTLKDVQTITKWDSKDPIFISTLKDKVMSDYLATGSLVYYSSLSSNEELIHKIINGQIDDEKLESSLKSLVKPLNATDSDLEELRIQYYLSSLDRLTKNVNDTLNTTDFSNISSSSNLNKMSMKLINALNQSVKGYFNNSIPNLELLNKINIGVESLDNVNVKLNQINKFKSILSSNNSDEILTYLNQGWTPPKEFLNQYNLLNKYSENLIEYNNFQTKLKELKDNIDFNKNNKDKIIEIPNLVGKTLKEAKEEVTKLGLKLQIKGLSQEYSLPKGYDLDSDDKLNHEDLKIDENKSTIILQTPVTDDTVKYIYKDEIMYVNLEVIPVEKVEPITPPTKESSTLSSSSTSESSTTSESSSSRDNTSNDNNSNDDTTDSTTEQPEGGFHN